MITNADVFNALKTLETLCVDHYECDGKCECPLNNGYDECILHYISHGYVPSYWDVESLRPLLDPASVTLDD